MKFPRLYSLAVFSAATLMISTPAMASILLDGKTIQYQYLFPTITNNHPTAGNGNKLVGAGIEVLNFPGNVGTMDISDTNLYIDFSRSTRWNPASFNGFRITDIFSTIADFTGVTINPSSNMAGLTLSRISFDADNIWVNWNGLSVNSNTIVSLDITGDTTSANIPEPTTFLVWGGLGVCVAAATRRRRGAGNR